MNEHKDFDEQEREELQQLQKLREFKDVRLKEIEDSGDLSELKEAKELIKRIFNQEMVSYLFFGVLTTLVNYLVFVLLIRFFGDGAALWANVVAFVAAVTFAYITNKVFVFKSKSWEWKILKRELPSFLSARVISFLFEEAGLIVCVNWLHAASWELFGIGGVMVSKIILSVVVVIINYILSKFFIFKPGNRQ